MRMVSPDGPVYQAGTLSGNPIATAAGLATLRILEADTDIYMRLQENTAMLAGCGAPCRRKPCACQSDRLSDEYFLHREKM